MNKPFIAYKVGEGVMVEGLVWNKEDSLLLVDLTIYFKT